MFNIKDFLGHPVLHDHAISLHNTGSTHTYNHNKNRHNLAIGFSGEISLDSSCLIAEHLPSKKGREVPSSIPG